MAQKKIIVIEAKDKTGAAFGKVKKNLKQTEVAVDKTKRSFDGLKAGIKGAIGALTIGAFVQFTKSSLDAASALEDTAERLGLTTEGLQTLRFAAEQSGMATEGFEMAMQRFTRRLAEAGMGTGVLKETFKQLGLEIENSNGTMKTADHMLGEVADKLATIPDQGERVRLAFSMFDSEGVKMVNMLQGGAENLASMRQELIDTGGVLGGDFIKDAGVATKTMGKLSSTIGVIMVSALSGVAPWLTKASKLILDLIKASNRYPIIGYLTAAVIGLSTALAVFAIAGGPVTLAIMGVSALTIGLVELYAVMKKEKKVFEGMALEELHKQFNIINQDIMDMVEKQKVLKDAAFFGGGEQIEKEIQGLEAQRDEVVKLINKFRELREAQKGKDGGPDTKAYEGITETMQKFYSDDLTLAFENARKKEEILEKEAYLKQLFYTNDLTAAFDHARKIRQIRLEEINETLVNFGLQREAQATWFAEKALFRDAEMGALKEQHERQKALVDLAYMGETQNKELHTENMLLIDKRYDQAVKELYIQRASSILGQASATARELNKAGAMGFETMKGFAIAEAMINAYGAASKAWFQGGAFGAISAALTLTMAMAQVENIRRTKPPSRERGGSVSRGKPFMVGEKGPELFTPNQSGNITANNDLGDTNVSFNISANDARGFDQLLQARRGMIIGMINQALRGQARAGIV